jgi:hypothetical protein
MTTALDSPEVVEQLNARGIDATPSSLEGYARFMRAEEKKWVPIIKQADIKP